MRGRVRRGGLVGRINRVRVEELSEGEGGGAE